MQYFTLDTPESINEFNLCVKDKSIQFKEYITFNKMIVSYNKEDIIVEFNVKDSLLIDYGLSDTDKLIFGKCPQKNIVNISYKDNNQHIFTEKDSIINEYIIPYKPWVLAPVYNSQTKKLKGKNHFNYIKVYESEEDYNNHKSAIYKHGLYTIANPVESFMTKEGFTYFKGMKIEELSILSFDIETTTLNPKNSKAEVKIIANTLYKNKAYSKKTFIVDDYKNDYEMIQSWCSWVKDVNPSLLTGHNIYIFDIPYLFERAKGQLPIGRDGSNLVIEDREREKRKDGSQSYTYRRPIVFGRDLLDTFFLMLTADALRVFESYALKPLIKAIGEEKEGRTYVDPSKILELWHNLEYRIPLIKYAEDDSEDPLKLIFKFASAHFYFTQHIPKPFQLMIETATGSQINSFLMRSYLQDEYALPKAYNLDEEKVQGGISFGVPGIYKHLLKIDLKSAYPSQVLRFKLYNPIKDPKAHFHKMVEYFTLKRFDYKKLGKETGDSYYKDLDAVSKIFINSAYGVMNTGGLNFNDADIARKITKETREVIDMSLRWASGKDYRYWINTFYDKMEEKPEDRNYLDVDSYLIVNKNYDFIIGPTDTDSISFCKKDMTPFSPEEVSSLVKEVNLLSPEFMIFEDDGYYDSVLVLRAKNYVLKKGDKYTFKGSALKSSKLEPMLKELLHEMIKDFLENEGKCSVDIYNKYLKEALNPTDIKKWSQKKTITKPVLNCKDDVNARKNERNIYDAVKGKHIQEGDKIYVYPSILDRTIEKTVLKNGKERVKETLVTGLKCVEDYNSDHNSLKLVDRVHDTVLIFKGIVGKNFFINYSLVKNRESLNGFRS